MASSSQTFPVAQSPDDEMKCADCGAIVDKNFIVLEGAILCMDCVEEVDHDPDDDEDDDADDDQDDDGDYPYVEEPDDDDGDDD
jgi:hypothetical protein